MARTGEAFAVTQLGLPGLQGVEAALEWEWIEEVHEEATVETFVHATVMKDEVVAVLGPVEGGIYVDATLGGGGHTEAILEEAPGARVIAFDRDQVAIDAARVRLERFGDAVIFVHSSFGKIGEAIEGFASSGGGEVRGLIADLGVSSPQLDEAERGMSFRREGPIDMRMDQESGETALDLIERLSDEDLANVIFRYGDERRSRRIARSLKRAFGDGDLVTTLDLRRAVVRAVGPQRIGGVDPATRTFQALRIAVNDELGELAALLAALPGIFADDATAAFLSFHSHEDRLVKRAFADRSTWEPVWKKPVMASEEEKTHNVRSRSAKLRAARFRRGFAA